METRTKSEEQKTKHKLHSPPQKATVVVVAVTVATTFVTTAVVVTAEQAPSRELVRRDLRKTP